MRTKAGKTPCNGCTACCKGDAPPVMPEHGDKPQDYVTEVVTHKYTGAPSLAIARKPNGDCHYLGPRGCTIHDRVPYACRVFDCRVAVLRVGGPEAQARALAQGRYNPGVFAAGAKRLHTLRTKT